MPSRQDYAAFLFVSGSSTLALAGCVSPNADPTPTESNNTTDNQTDPPTAPDTQGTSPAFTVETTSDDLPDDISFEVMIENDDIVSKPPIFTVSLTNTSDTSYQFAERRQAIYIAAQSKTGTYVLYPTNTFTADKYERNGSVWDATEGYIQTMDYQIGTLNPDESASAELALLRGQQNSGATDAYPNEIQFTTEFKLTGQDSQTDLQNAPEITTTITITFDSTIDTN